VKLIHWKNYDVVSNFEEDIFCLLLYAMFKRIRAKLPDWRFIAFVISNSIPGKKLLGDWRFPPIFFAAGFLFEIVLCKLRINNINFCMCDLSFQGNELSLFLF
jgi:hypothetical protein